MLHRAVGRRVERPSPLPYVDLAKAATRVPLVHVGGLILIAAFSIIRLGVILIDVNLPVDWHSDILAVSFLVELHEALVPFVEAREFFKLSQFILSGLVLNGAKELLMRKRLI
jgi:hypothetical protein